MPSKYVPPTKRALAELHTLLEEQVQIINGQDAEIQRLGIELEALHRLAAQADPQGYYLLMADLAREEVAS